jgi:hypothetical protein
MPHEYLRVWIAMLAKTDATGYVRVAAPAMARLCHLTREDFDRVIDAYCAPDPESRTADHEGRRLERVEGGWQILNYTKYRECLKQPDHSTNRVKKYREKQRQCNGSTVSETDETICNAYAEAEAEAEAKKDPSPGPADAGHGGEGASESKPSTSKPESWKTKPDPLAAYPRLLEAYPKIEKKILELHPHAKLPTPGTKQYFDSRQTLARLVSIDKHTESDVLSTLSWVVAKQQPGRDGFLWRDHFQSINGLRNITDGMTKFAKMQKSMQKALESPPKPAPGEDLPEYIRDAMKAAGKL